ncbi:hypothetical protein BB561_001254 [Smittium simulii]|uniref:Uncharacterized protein n=1 Tax=Smittium simulii TaxID=133385 RepID=A0A2T9YVG9_9FUNG|nr:hypothetical protein BB561_001254 [Smittium simulii]
MARIPRFHRGGRGSIPRIGGGSVAQWTRRLTTNQEIPVLIPIGAYGGELFGISEQRNSPVQKASDQALRLIAGVGKNTALNRLRTEYGINTISSKTSYLRERDYIKWPILRT